MTEISSERTAERYLAAARATMAKVTDCWAATPSAEGGVSVRVVVPIPGLTGEDAWTLWIMTGGNSRKAGEIRRAGRLTLGYQHHPERAYVALMGRAALIEERSLIRARWEESWRTHFPAGPDDPRLVFVRFTVDRIELCVPGVSPDPYGSRHGVLVRDAAGRWAVPDQ